MAVFEYTGLTIKGKEAHGVIDAETPQAARQKLRKQGVFPTEVLEEDARARTGDRLVASLVRGVQLQHLTLLTRQMATLLRAALPLTEALGALIEQTEQPRLQRILAQVRERVREGQPLATSLELHPQAFSPLYVNMVRAGETGGSLDLIFARLADHLEGQLRLRNRLRAALAYPVLMTIIGLGILAFLMAYVVPQVTQIFRDLHQALPLPTTILIGVSQVLRDFWWLLVLAALGAGVALRQFTRTAEGAALVDRWLLKLPVFGKVIRMVAVARFARTLGTLLASGVPLMPALEIARAIVGNTVLARAVAEAQEAVRRGEELARPLERSGLFPPLLTHMIAVGERSGDLEGMLMKVSEAYEHEVETAIAGLTSLLEPVMILMMGAVVGFVVLSILLPIMEINQIIR